jgi:Protein of unknown function (DUF4058)
MASPFPGMDPYLEGSLWTTVHTTLAVEIVRRLNPQLLPRYVALSSRRFVMESPEDLEISVETTYPDVAVVQSAPTQEEHADIETFEAPLRMATLTRTPVPHITVEIRDIGNRRVVTVIEILSPTNKRGEGYDEYTEKRDRTLRGSAHLIELDLLRRGRRVPMQRKLPRFPYFAFLCRHEDRFIANVWPISLDKPLPSIPVPLLPGDVDAKLDLQQALTNVYDECGLRFMIDYSKPPEVPLSPEQAAWADEILRTAGLRP